MSYRLQRSESVLEGIQRIAREQLKKAEREIQNEEMDRHETVHQVRKRFKKLRGLIRLVRPAFEKTYQRENAAYREIGRDLSAVRDAQSMIEAFDRLVEKQESAEETPFGGIRGHLLERRKQIAGEQTDVTEALASIAEEIECAKERSKDWELKDKGFEAIAAGFEKTYARGQAALEEAAAKKANVEDFHEWRKRVKYHWYHCRLLENVWKPLMKARRDQAKILSDLLGDDHDLSLLDRLMTEQEQEFPSALEVTEFRELIQSSQKTIRYRAILLGRRIYADRPKHLCRRLDSWWSTWRDAA